MDNLLNKIDCQASTLVKLLQSLPDSAERDLAIERAVEAGFWASKAGELGQNTKDDEMAISPFRSSGGGRGTR
jgi:hypothetical protein